MEEVVIVAAGRTAAGKSGGALAGIAAADPGAYVISLRIGGGMGVALAIGRQYLKHTSYST